MSQWRHLRRRWSTQSLCGGDLIEWAIGTWYTPGDKWLPANVCPDCRRIAEGLCNE